ncbi:MAG TPA: single-stranded-DNA-specific exonuclease RecJ [Fibrobacteraceae bacterium]|nr:single-stranded-DNA-specific exonuclease RecJ [Fibrobacteraceae bacterium]
MDFSQQVIPSPPSAPSVELDALVHSLQCPVWFANLLWMRGYGTPEQAQQFLDAPQDSWQNPWLLKGMENAVQVLLDFRNKNQTLCVFGDYDLDGISGTALLCLALKRAGGWNVTYRLPSRFGDGYGLSIAQVNLLHQSGVQCLVLVDTGITALAEIAHARKLGMTVVVVDHHRPSGDGLPVAHAILDPWQPDCQYPNKDLSAVGVALKLVWALYERLDLGGADAYLDLVALGTLSDMMPLGPENRQILRRALARMYRSEFPGVRVLCADAVDSSGYLGSQDILFRIAPLMNAPGRLESPDIALEMLLSPSETEAKRTLEQLRTANEKRRGIEAELTSQAMRQAQEIVQQSRVLVVTGEKWHLGVLGIVASKLTQQYGRPSAVVSIQPDGNAMGSVRGVEGFNWHQALSDAHELFDRWGGHQNAAGFSLPASRLGVMRERFERSAVGQGYAPGEARPTLECHVEARLCQMNQDAMEWLRRLEPCGRGNPPPIFLARNVQLPSGVREVRGGHLQFEAMQSEGVRYATVGFGLGHAAEWLRHQDSIDMTFVPSWNSYRGRRILQLQVKNIAKAQGNP